MTLSIYCQSNCTPYFISQSIIWLLHLRLFSIAVYFLMNYTVRNHYVFSFSLSALGAFRQGSENPGQLGENAVNFSITFFAYMFTLWLHILCAYNNSCWAASDF
jgi:hypothetical protein